MIRGSVLRFQARIRLPFRIDSHSTTEIETVVDTGFNGWLALPPSLVADLRLPWNSEGYGRLADGTESRFEIHEATILWFGRVRKVEVYALGIAPIIGMSLLFGCEFNMKVRPRGAVTIKKLRGSRSR